MKKRYLSLVLILLIIVALPATLCGCVNSHKSKIKITHKSKIPQSMRKTANGVIDLSDGRNVNFGGHVGPHDPIGPEFNMVTVDKR